MGEAIFSAGLQIQKFQNHQSHYQDSALEECVQCFQKHLMVWRQLAESENQLLLIPDADVLNFAILALAGRIRHRILPDHRGYNNGNCSN